MRVFTEPTIEITEPVGTGGVEVILEYKSNLVPQCTDIMIVNGQEKIVSNVIWNIQNNRVVIAVRNIRF